MRNQLLLIISLFLAGKNLQNQDVTFSFENTQITSDGVDDSESHKSILKLIIN